MPFLAADAQKWKYVGGPGGRNGAHRSYWNLTMEHAEIPEPRALCACGVPFASANSTYYVQHADTEEIDTIGRCCFKLLPPHNRRKTCSDCGRNHVNTLVNKCNSCRGVRSRRTRNEEREDPFEYEEIEVDLKHLAWFSRVVFPATPHNVSWTCNAQIYDDSRLFFNMFYEGQIQATFHYDTEADRIGRIRWQGGLAIKAQIDANWERLNDTMFFLVQMSILENRVSEVVLTAPEPTVHDQLPADPFGLVRQHSS